MTVFISTMGFPILVRWHLHIESGPWLWNMEYHVSPNILFLLHIYHVPCYIELCTNESPQHFHCSTSYNKGCLIEHYIQPLTCWIVSRHHTKYIWFSMISHWDDAYEFKLSSFKTKTCLCYTINIIAANDLVKQGVREEPTMILTFIS